MSSYTDTTNLPPGQARSVLHDARVAREIARTQIAARFRAERQAQALAEAQAAQQRIAEAGGIRALGRADYKRELAAMQSRLRRAR